MTVEYRTMSPEDEAGTLALWMATWPVGDPEFRKSELISDPLFHDHTFLARDSATGEVMAAAHYWVQLIRDAGGTPRRVGCVSHVATAPAAQRQGHASTLMRMALESMRRDGLDWSLLFSSNMGVPVYQRLGYRAYSAPYRRGLITRIAPPGAGQYRVKANRLTTGGGLPGAGWDVLERIYAEYNVKRPLTVVRDANYWRTFAESKLVSIDRVHPVVVFTAHQSVGSGEAVAYLTAHFSPSDYSRTHHGLDQVFTMQEAAALDGHHNAIPTLMHAAALGALPGRVGSRLFLPFEEPVDSAAAVVYGSTLQTMDDRGVMALPVSEGFAHDDLEAMFSAPGAVHCLLDEF